MIYDSINYNPRDFYGVTASNDFLGVGSNDAHLKALVVMYRFYDFDGKGSIVWGPWMAVSTDGDDSELALTADSWHDKVVSTVTVSI